MTVDDKSELARLSFKMASDHNARADAILAKIRDIENEKKDLETLARMHRERAARLARFQDELVGPLLCPQCWGGIVPLRVPLILMPDKLYKCKNCDFVFASQT